MYRQLRTCLAGTILVATAQAPAPAGADDDGLAVCRASAARYVEAIGTGDPAKVAAVFTEAGLVNAPEGIFPGREAIIAFDRAFVMPGVSQTVTAIRADSTGPGLLCSGTYVVSFAPGFPMKQVAGNYTALVVREGRVWQHAMLAYNYALPPMPPRGE